MVCWEQYRQKFEKKLKCFPALGCRSNWSHTEPNDFVRIRLLATNGNNLTNKPLQDGLSACLPFSSSLPWTNHWSKQNKNLTLSKDFNSKIMQEGKRKNPKKILGSSPPPHSLNYEFYGLTSGFTRLTMKAKYVCYGLVSLHVIVHDNRTKWTVNSSIKICRWGVKGKRVKFWKILFMC